MISKEQWDKMSNIEKQQEILARAYMSKSFRKWQEEWQEEGRKRCQDYKMEA